MPIAEVCQPSEASQFTPTIWSLIKDGAQGKHDAQTRIWLLYHRPVFLFLQRRLAKRTPELDAEVIAGEVMDTVLAPSFLSKADQLKGRFRSLLCAVSKYAMSNAMRNAHAQRREAPGLRVPMDQALSDITAAIANDRGFDRFYAQEVMSAARERLDAEGGEESRTYAHVLDLHYNRGLTQMEIAQALCRTKCAVNSLLHRARKALETHLDAVLHLVASTEDEIEQERLTLLQILSRRGRRR